MTVELIALLRVGCPMPIMAASAAVRVIDLVAVDMLL